MIPTHTPQAAALNLCTSPEVGRLLADYVVDLLDDYECERVEMHMVSCWRCKEHYLTVLRARQEERIKGAGMIEQSHDGVVTPGCKAPADAIPSVKRKGKASSGSLS